MSRFSLAVCALAAVLSACGGDSTASNNEWAGSMTDSAGVTIVSNPTSPTWSSDEAWTLEEVLLIGEAAGDADYQFGQIAGLGVTSDGSIFVLMASTSVQSADREAVRVNSDLRQTRFW